MQWMSRLAMIMLIAATAIAAAPETTRSLSTDAQTLDQQMRSLLLEREQILAELAEQAKLAPLSERTARDAEYAATQTQYEIQLLELMVQYYELTGNVELHDRAAENLAQILAPEAKGTLDSDTGNRSSQSETQEGR